MLFTSTPFTIWFMIVWRDSFQIAHCSLGMHVISAYLLLSWQGRPNHKLYVSFFSFFCNAHPVVLDIVIYMHVTAFSSSMFVKLQFWLCGNVDFFIIANINITLNPALIYVVIGVHQSLSFLIICILFAMKFHFLSMQRELKIWFVVCVCVCMWCMQVWLMLLCD